MANDECVIAILLSTVMLISGTSGSVEGTDAKCDGNPDAKDLKDTWGGLVDRTPEGYDGVGFLMEPRGSDEPSSYVDWDEWSPEKRPGLISDVLCHMKGMIETGGENPEWVVGSVETTENVVGETVEKMNSEHARQNGERDEFCCMLRVMDRFYAVAFGWHFHPNAAKYHAEARDVFRFEGRLDTGVVAQGNQVAQEASEPFSFSVKSAVDLIHVEADWDDDQFALDLLMQSPGAEDGEWDHTAKGGSLGMSKRPLNLTVYRDDVEDWSGDWEVTMRAADLALDVDYQIVVTIFNWESELPEGYSAL